jgi:hypothetical protein
MWRSSVWSIFVVAVALTSACRSQSSDGGTPAPTASGTAGNTLVVDVHRTGSTVTIDYVRAYDSSASLPPRAAGDYVLVASSGGKAVAAVSFAFPTTMVSEGQDDNGQLVGVQTDVSDDTVTSVRLPNGAYDSLTVLDASGATVAAQTAGLPPAAANATGALTDGADGISRTTGALIAGPLKGRARYSAAQGLIFLEPEDQPHLPPKIQAQIQPTGGLKSFDSLSDAEQAEIMAGLTDTPAAPLESVSYIAFVHYSKTGGAIDGITGKASGNQVDGFVLMNADYDLSTRFTETMVVHEAAHAYTQALGEVGTAAATTNWPPDVQTLTQAVVSQFPFPQGFKVFWYKMQNDWVSSRLGGAYYLNGGWSSITDMAANAQGFVRNYGAYTPDEDISTYVEQLAPGSQVTPYFCPILQGLASAGSFPVVASPPFVKALLLASVGYISPTDYTRCVGPSLPLQGSLGFRFMNGTGGDVFDFTDHLDGMTGNDGATMTGDDQANGAVTASISSRFGFTRLTGGPLASVSLPGLGLNATDGLALLVPSAPGTIAAAAFNVELSTPSGSTTIIPFAQFTVMPKKPPTTLPFVTSCLLVANDGTPLACYDEYGKLTQNCAGVGVASDMPCPTDNIFGSCDDGAVLPGAYQIRHYYNTYPAVNDPTFGPIIMNSCVSVGSIWTPGQ